MKKMLNVLTIVTSFFIPAIGLSEESPLKCEQGPVRKSYGGTNWIVYSCADNTTVVIASDKGSPATPFLFTFYRNEGGYKLHGEGTGDRNATDAAYKELSQLSESEIKVLIQETKNKK